MEEADKIELRSEKVRNIIGEIPPSIVRYGIIVITFIVLGLLAASYFISYPETITAKATALDERRVSISLPYRYVNTIKKGMPVNVEFEGYDAQTYGYQEGMIIRTDRNVKVGQDDNSFSAIVLVNTGK